MISLAANPTNFHRERSKPSLPLNDIGLILVASPFGSASACGSAEGISFRAYPALIPQRASRASGTDWAIIFRA